MDEHPSIHFNDDTLLHVTYDRMREHQVYLQNFAIFVEPQNGEALDMNRIRRNLDTFRQRIIVPHDLTVVRSNKDLLRLHEYGGIGAILSVEGCDCLQTPASDVVELYESGIRIISLTWNYSNWAADGCYGSEHCGLSEKGKHFVNICNQLGMILDVSHLSDQSFSQLAEISNKPFVATHSNCRAICEHPRNLSDAQIKSIINSRGVIGLNLVPMFVDTHKPDISAFLQHYEHLCELGGAKHVALGTDFDGVDKTIHGLENSAKLHVLSEWMTQRYGDERTNDFFYHNWFHFLSENLP